MNWEWLIGETNLTGLLPEAYAKYAKPLQGALTLFLEGLPPLRQGAIAMEQTALPLTASVAERLVLLARSSPVLHKLGQTLARDRKLSPELRNHLQQLESLSPSIPFEAVKSALEQQLGPLGRLGVTLFPPALAEASVAVVVPFRFTSGKGYSDGVFKVLKPGIEARLDQELQLLEQVGSFLDERCEDLEIPHLEYRNSFERVRAKLRYEVSLDREQRNLTMARNFYRGDRRVRIPALFDLCTPRVTAMERVIGRKVTECSQESLGDRRKIAKLLVEALISRPVFSREAQALFHGDPHAGNLFSTSKLGLAILDWSLTGSLGEKERDSIMQIMLGAISFRAEKTVAALCGLSSCRDFDLETLKAIVYRWINRILDGQIPGLRWLVGLLDDVVSKAGLRFKADLLLFRRTLRMVEDIVTDIVGESDLIDQVLQCDFFIHFSAEWPRRLFAFPDSHEFATRLSNIDLAELALSFPWRALLFRLDAAVQFQRAASNYGIEALPKD